ncbi:hypothetical protein H072_6116 [Dactylellina haptotyla CBS 200.50]|uniref:Alpha-L-rhamnosidase six-hairpin glycosidase domain-containing protein n=1 Tax=Dactylellina haptotyla (strain CBS 200.50) TaxID=1284197 RepID=S8BKZ4_DACHA|nr:hypothetical protein H072_6116 [Dactylellina haptotyla CBS 200.50]
MMLRSAALLTLCAARTLVSGLAFEGHGVEPLFEGPWEEFNKAPLGRIVRPVKVYATEGDVSSPEGIINGGSTTFRPGSLVTYEFAENIAGRVCWTIGEASTLSKGATNSFKLSFGFTESPNFIGRHSDATTSTEFDLPLDQEFRAGNNTFDKIYVRGAYKYMTIWVNENTTYQDTAPSWTLTDLWVPYAAMPHFENPKAYTGYFHSSDNLLNRIWYAGAYTLQLTTINPEEGGSLVDFNRRVDHNNFPRGAWASNFTVSNGSSVTTDGAKRDRMVYAGDMTIAVPGIAVSTFDLDSIKNALETLFAHQYWDGGMPYAGPPMGFYGEYSDTYHLHALLGVWNYVHYSGDVAWMAGYWTRYKRALNISLRRFNRYRGLYWCWSTADWLRPGQGGYNSEANAIFYLTVKKSMALAEILGPGSFTLNEMRLLNDILGSIESNYQALWDEEKNMFMDNMDTRRDVHPQDGNSWAIFADGLIKKDQAKVISRNLRKRWTKYGAPAVEMPNTISPFATSFELIAHCYAGEHQSAVDLMRIMWGYMLDGKGMTNSTFIEGFRLDGNIQYPAYGWSGRNSHAHGWSTGPTYVLSTEILGIKLTQPMGYSWVIEPNFVDLDWAEGGYATELGKFTVRWKKGGKLLVQTPEGTSGDVIWHGKTRRLQGGKAWVWDEDGWRAAPAIKNAKDKTRFRRPDPAQERLGLERLRFGKSKSRANGQSVLS